WAVGADDDGGGGVSPPPDEDTQAEEDDGEHARDDQGGDAAFGGDVGVLGHGDLFMVKSLPDRVSPLTPTLSHQGRGRTTYGSGRLENLKGIKIWWVAKGISERRLLGSPV